MESVLFFHNMDDFTGSTRVLENVIREEYSDKKVVIISRKSPNGPLSALPNVHILGIFYPTLFKRRIPILSFLISQIHVFLLTAFYGLFYKKFYINTITPYYAGLIGKIYGKEIIYHIHEKFMVKDAVMRFSEYVFDHVNAHRIFVSRYLEKAYAPRTGCTSEIKYNTLSESFLSKVEIVPIAERPRQNVLMLCSMTKAKGIFTFIDLARALPQLSFRLVISDTKEHIAQFLGDTPLSQNLEILPKQSDIHALLRKADLNLNLSIPELWIETFGMTILESMVYGIPSIVPNIGGPIELVEDGVNGYCVDVQNLPLLSEKVQMALVPDNYARMATNALEVSKKFL